MRAADGCPAACLPHQDQKDALVGRIFGFAAIVRAGLASSDADVALAAARGLAAAGSARSFLREAASEVLVTLLEGAEGGVAAHVMGQCEGLRAMLTAPPDEASAEVGGGGGGGGLEVGCGSGSHRAVGVRTDGRCLAWVERVSEGLAIGGCVFF